MQKARKVSQILFLLFSLYLFLLARYPYSGTPDSDLFLRFSPLLPLIDLVQNFRVSWLFWPAIVIVIVTPFTGRFFCSWICPLGTTLDAASKVVKSPSNKAAVRWEKWKLLKFAILTGVLILAAFSVNLWSLLDPLALFNRVLTAVFYPLFTFLTESTLLQLSEYPVIGSVADWAYDPFKKFIMPEKQAMLQQTVWIAMFFIFILGLEKLSRRFWCRNVCPVGAWLGFLSQFRFYERVVSETCPVCNKCQSECKMNAIPEGDVKLTSKVECIECFNCGAVCPPKANAISYRWRWKPYHTPVDFERRQFLTTSVSSVAALGLLRIGLQDRAKSDRMIRPPGALPETEFLDKCIRCLQCVRICSANGACLQPSGIQNRFPELWTPVALMREGYCEYNCNLCGQVCPTEAILPLTLAQKQTWPMGLAYFNKNTCIPFAENRDCIVCEEHCPLPDKAIKFEVKEYSGPDGKRMMIKYPYVIRELCTGCGICETKCPLKGEAGIYVTHENEKRVIDRDEEVPRGIEYY